MYNLQYSRYPTICILIRYENNHGFVSQMTLYRGRIPCIMIQFSTLQYCDICVSIAETCPGCTTREKFQKKILFFMDRVGFCMTLQKKPPNLPGFLGSGLFDPSNNACEPFCIQGFCFVTYQLIWSYSQKPLTFSSFTASSTYTICFPTLYGLYVWFWLN
jgi:hypothetical protein